LGVIEVVSLLLAGLVAGFAAGLFGIGGGVILVPVFWLLFKSFGVGGELSVKLSVATSLSVIAFTTLFTSASHLLRGALTFRETLKLFLFSAPGVALGVGLAKVLPANLLKKLFGLLLVLLGLRNASGAPLKKGGFKRGEELIPLSVFISGFFSSLFGIGGGVVVNSILFSFSSIPVERVVAVASLSSFLNALFGTLLYMLLPAQKVLSYQVGFVYLPATLLVSAGSIAGSRLGLKVLRRVSQSHLKRAFSLFMILIGLKVLI
jgi:uncharacterized membrane protein YfcA